MTRPSPIMDRVLQIITAAPGLTVAQIAERAGVTGDQVSNALFKLHTRHGEAYRLSVPGARASVWFNTRRQAERFRDSRFPDKPQRAEASPGQQVSMIDRVLDVVNANPGLFVAQIAERAGVTAGQCRNSLNRLATRRFKVYRADPAAGSAEGRWYPVGVLPARASTANGAALPTPPNRIDRMSGTYTCPELYAPPSRPGAMDAYRLPSRGACDGGRP